MDNQDLNQIYEKPKTSKIFKAKKVSKFQPEDGLLMVESVGLSI